MSQENVKLAREFFDAYDRGDFEATLQYISPEWEFRPSGLFMDTEGTYYGREGWSEFWHTFREAWETITVDLVRIEDLGNQVLILGTFHGRGHGSGVDVTREVAWLGTVRDGLFVQTLTFVSWAEALEAAGLTESAMSEENVEIVRGFATTVSAGDMDAFTEFFADDAVVQSDPSFPEGGTLVGPEAIRHFHEGLGDGWKEGGGIFEKDIRSAENRVFVEFDWNAIGEASGIEMSSKWYLVFWLSDRRIDRVCYFRDRAKALEAAGLAE